jgi:multiple sugar transport system substrate-binding protein
MAGQVHPGRRLPAGQRRVAKLPSFADNADLKEFAALLPDARFAPVILGWEEIAAKTSDALQKIYLGDGEIQPTLDAAAADITGILGL